MESRARLFGHPIHQQLVAFPVGLLVTTTVFDVIHAFTGGPVVATVAYWTLVAGLVGALAAAPFGALDWAAIPAGTRAKRIGALHGGGNVLVLILYAVSWWIRRDAMTDTPGVAIVISVVGVALAGCTAWLGGELVSRLGVGVSDGAGVDAASSLDGPLHARRATPQG